MATTLVRRSFQVDVVARNAGLHPDLVRQLWRLGLVEEVDDAPVRLRKALRLRRDLGLNYAGAVLAVDLLARIEHLEQRLRRYESPRG
jgi:hypothetical protein